jgi:hypothetical protein
MQHVRGDRTQKRLFGSAFFGVIFSSLIILLFVTSSTVNAAQAIPYKINYQGRLTNSAGTIVANGLYNVKFSIYDALTGGTLKWQESRETTTRVQITNGLFDVRFGDVTALTPALFGNSTQLYLQVELPTPASATCATAACGVFTEGPLTPRQPIAASPYAFNADTVDGIDGSSLARSDQANTFSGNQTVGGNVTATNLIQGSNAVCDVSNNCGDVRIGGNSTGSRLVVGTNDANTLGLETGGVEYLTINTAGKVTIGGGGSSTGAGLAVYNWSPAEITAYFKTSDVGQTADQLRVTSSSNTNSLRVTATGITVIQPETGNGPLLVRNAAGTNILRVYSDDKIGLGNGASPFGAIKKVTTTWDPPSTANGAVSGKPYSFGKNVILLGVETPATPTCGGFGCTYTYGDKFNNGVAYSENSVATKVDLKFGNYTGAAVNPGNATWVLWYLEP